ncbi:M48 family metalloprotease [Xanthobacter sp. TB0139]|uniref:M48 family metalloprotease n=1 Tax=Xanthobacter sp. TB0139 TaxID=3459178 RepID=UPI00403A4E44
MTKAIWKKAASAPFAAPPAPSPACAPRQWLAPALRALLLGAALLTPLQDAARHSAQAQAQQNSPVLIRDTEIENLMRDYTTPILSAAGLGRQNVEVVLIQNPSFNAFVADGRRIFVNTGALMDSETPNQIIGVLAHEAGHIAGGHLARMREQMAGAQAMAVVAMMLAGAGVAAGAAAGMDGRDLGQAAAAGMTLPQHMLHRSLLSYKRSEEQTADRAAVRYLDATGQSAKGMLETFRRFQRDQFFVSQRIDPYMLSHPLAHERIAALETLAKASPNYHRKDSPSLQARHALMRAKLVGFTQRPDMVARKYPSSDHSLAADYARAISAYRHSDMNSALRRIDALIARAPDNPYFHELKGQALLEGGRPAQAVAPLRKAVEMTGDAPLIRAMLGQALVGTGKSGRGKGAAKSTGSTTQDAIYELIKATVREPDSPSAWRQLAIAYGQRGDKPNADLAAANAALASSEFETARHLAARARRGFSAGSPGWLKADDILKLEPPKPKASSRR